MSVVETVTVTVTRYKVEMTEEQAQAIIATMRRLSRHSLDKVPGLEDLYLDLHSNVNNSGRFVATSSEHYPHALTLEE